MSSPHVESFISDLERELRDQELSLLDAEFLEAVERKEVSREQIGEWAKVFYAATRHGRLTIGNFYANAPDDTELRRELAENIFEEETGGISGVGRCHMDVFEDFLSAFEITPEQAATLTSPMGEHLPQGHAIPPEEFYIDLSAYGFSVEIPNAEFCERIAKALRENYGFSEEHVRWFTMHAELDADHGDEFKKHALKVANDPAGLDRLREKTLAMSRGVQSVWNGFGVWAGPS